MLAGPRVDGGTTFQVAAPPAEWHRALGSARADEQVLSVEVDGGEVLQFLARRRGRIVDLIATEDQTRLVLYDAPMERGGPRMRLQAPKHVLWTEGLGAWLRRWLDRASQIGLGQRCLDVLQAAALGWATEHVDICIDYAGPPDLFGPADVLRLRKSGKGVAALAHSTRRLTFSALHAAGHGSRQRGSELSMALQHKSEVVRDVDKCEPSDSLYAPTWRANGWVDTDDVWRVEFRLRRGALCRRSLDVRDPARLLDPATIRSLFADALRRYDLAGADGSTDARWIALREAAALGSVDLGPTLPTGSPLAPAALRRRLRNVAVGKVVDFVTSSVIDAGPEDVRDVIEVFGDAAKDDARLALALARRKCEA